MASDEDKATAWVSYRGEADRLIVRRPRLDRDGLYLFGRRYDSQSLTVTAAELTALAQGRWIVVDLLGEYLLYIRFDRGEPF